MSRKFRTYKKVPKADGIKQLRDGVLQGDSCSTTKSGDWPIRMKGYHRAVKRGEKWALDLGKPGTIVFALKWLYRPSILAKLVYSDNPWLKVIPKDDATGFCGKYIPIPITFGSIT